MKSKMLPIKYSQPDFYHFNQDTILLADHIEKGLLEYSKKPLRLLDAFSGCGILGIELTKRLKSVKQVSFCEIQPSFHSHIEKNIILQLDDSVTTNIIPNSFFDLDLNQYDLIVGNPPYFSKDSGRLPQNQLRSLCRFSHDHFYRDLYNKVLNTASTSFFLYKRTDASISIDERFKTVEIDKNLMVVSV